MARKAKTATLWYFEFCISNIGIWDRCWATSKRKLDEARRNLRDINSGIDRKITPDDELDGGYGQNSGARSVEVELTPQGVLDFAERYAVDDAY